MRRPRSGALTSRIAFDTLDDLHCWSGQYVDMRFDYKPDRPLYLIAVRAYRFAEPKVIDYHAAYAGCRSWVPLRPGDEVDEVGTQPAIDDGAFNAMVERINTALG